MLLFISFINKFTKLEIKSGYKYVLKAVNVCLLKHDQIFYFYTAIYNFVMTFSKCIWVIFIVTITATVSNSVMSANANAINSVDIVRASVEALPECLHYRITGLCYWLDWGAHGPEVSTTLKVRHYLPDAVVSVYPALGRNAWEFANTVIDKPASRIGNVVVQRATHNAIGWGQHASASVTDNNTYFYEVDIIGNPALWVLNNLLNELIIASPVQALLPYYQSMLDSFSWRMEIESYYPQSWLPVGNHIGNSIAPWGFVYPRIGSTVARNSAIAASVIALRAAHIVTRNLQPHIYHHLPTHCGEHCSIATVKANEKHTLWQRVYPMSSASTSTLVSTSSSAKRCVVLGEDNAIENLFDETQQQHVWVLWRLYQGCVQGKGQFIGAVG
jgi:integrating conjugative element protein (TIGR03756 family)